MPRDLFSRLDFGWRLSVARGDLTQAELAEKAGMHPTAITHYETGRRTPSMANLRILVDALDVSADYLIGVTDER